MQPILSLRPLALLAPASLAFLQGCGGGGGETVASAPPPVPAPPTPSTRTPLPPTPATTTGNYQGFATFTSTDASATTKQTLPDGRQVQVGPIETTAPTQLAPPGSVSLAVDMSTRTYTLTVNAGPYQFPAGKMIMPADTPLGFERNNPDLSGVPADWVRRGDMLASGIPAGRSPNGAQRSIVTFVRLYNAGQLNGSPRYVSAAYWGQFNQENESGIPGPENQKVTQETQGMLVFGQRTQPGEMPLSGQATFTLHSLFSPPTTDEDGNVTDFLGNLVLNVDFATKSLSGLYDRKEGGDTFKTDDEGYAITDDNGDAIVLGHYDTTVHASGSTTVANDGGFSLALTGTGTLHTVLKDQPPVADLVKPIAGSLDGAFFGPQAAEVGGIANLPRMSSDGSIWQYFTDFAGKRAGP